MSTTTWTLDPAHTQIEFGVKHMMFTTVRGQFSSFDGTVEWDKDDAGSSSVSIEIDAASIDTGVEDRDTHLRSGDFFDVEQFPKITFESARVSGPIEADGSFEVVGDLTMHGVTKPITLKATYEGTGTDPWGGTRAGFTASAKVDRRDFGLTWNQTLETGGVLVGKDIDISLQAQLVLQEETANV